ncbi:MAG: hypothetical protein WCT12_30565, partial [Verrucomicrobiota bacterium]
GFFSQTSISVFIPTLSSTKSTLSTEYTSGLFRLASVRLPEEELLRGFNLIGEGKPAEFLEGLEVIACTGYV